MVICEVIVLGTIELDVSSPHQVSLIGNTYPPGVYRGAGGAIGLVSKLTWHINYFWGSISGMYISGTCPNCQGMGEKQAGNLNLAPKKVAVIATKIMALYGCQELHHVVWC